MRSLVTGGAGFIGSHLVTALIERGQQVTVIDNFSTGRPTNLGHLDGSPLLSVVEADVADLAAIRPHLHGVDWAFHLAGLADIVPSISQPLAYHHSNVDGTAAVLEAARQGGVRRFMYAASSTCYGLPDVFPTPETAAIRPQYPYALTKWTGEQYVLHWGQVYGLPSVSLRLFNVYGPRSRTNGTYGAVFGVFLAQKLAGKPFTVVGDGNQTRDFTFVTDVVEAFIAAAESTVAGDVFNVGSGGTYSINRLVELLGGPVVHIPKRPGEPDCTFADTSKIRSTLGWQPSVSFEAGVAEMLKHIDNWREAPVWDVNSIAEANRDWFAFLGNLEQPIRSAA
ncbi:MAG TPA: SDR family oxidoreductase [Chloroflexota bacterium]|jgi:UDP-glucose 4-epimerase|nr:SDR family oxidoreductase [Chloroflexota bacterium]